MRSLAISVGLVAALLGTKALAREDRDRFISVEVGGGIGGFLDYTLWYDAGVAAQWTARAVVGTRSHFAGEVAYVGSLQHVNMLGVQPEATLLGNGVEGAFRLNVLTGRWQPYAIAGIGFMHYTLGSAVLTTSDVQQTGDVVTFPLGAGLAWRYRGLVLDARVSFHPTSRSGLLYDSYMGTWRFNTLVGYEL